MHFIGAGQLTRDAYHLTINEMELPGSEEDQKNIRTAFLDKFEERFKEYMEKHLDSHDRHLSEEAVDASIAFYASPVGEEMINASKIINELGEKLGLELAKAVFKDMANILEPYGDSADDE